jgi:hypothetical protein
MWLEIGQYMLILSMGKLISSLKCNFTVLKIYFVIDQVQILYHSLLYFIRAFTFTCKIQYCWAACVSSHFYHVIVGIKKKLHGLSPRAKYTDRATATCRRSDCQLLRIEGATWSA